MSSSLFFVYTSLLREFDFPGEPWQRRLRWSVSAPFSDGDIGEPAGVDRGNCQEGEGVLTSPMSDQTILVR